MRILNFFLKSFSLPTKSWTTPKNKILMAVGSFFLFSPDWPKQPRTSFLFYKFIYPNISGRISGRFWHAKMHIRIDSRPSSSRNYLNFFFTTISQDCFSILSSKFKVTKNNLIIPYSNVTSKMILLHCSKNIQYKSTCAC